MLESLDDRFFRSARPGRVPNKSLTNGMYFLLESRLLFRELRKLEEITLSLNSHGEVLLHDCVARKGGSILSPEDGFDAMFWTASESPTFQL